MIPGLLMVPLVGGLLAFLIRSDGLRRALLLVSAVIHSVLTAASWIIKPASSPQGWLALDQLGLLFLSLTSILFLAAAFYGVGYLKREQRGDIQDFEESAFFANAPEAIFTGSLLFFLFSMTLVVTSQHFGLLWVAIEATTLSSAPLIYFHRHHRSLEAAWKYLLICSVGIALALVGNFFLAVALADPSSPLLLSELIQNASRLRAPWLKAAFLFFLVGYGTKMGLAPLHTWLPDAHSESPSVVSALLSGALLNCAFLGIVRVFQVCAAAGELPFAQNHLVIFGLLSMAVAAVFIVGQTDYKRLLAYSSVEHMGILALGVGLGGAGTYGAMLHAMNHSFTKAMLFFVAGNLVGAYKTKSAPQVQGALKLLPLSGILWVAGFLAITGMPPFGLFLSEFTILKAALDAGRGAVAIIYLACLALIFMGMAGTVLRMAQGEIPPGLKTGNKEEPLSTVAPPAILGAFVLILGFYIPPTVHAALQQIADLLRSGR